MKIDIEDIKALEPGKVYAVSLDLAQMEAADATSEYLNEIAEKYNIKFIFLIKGCAEFVSVPEGMIFDTTSSVSFRLMEEEMLAFLEKTYLKNNFLPLPPETLLTTELGRIFRANKEYGAEHREAFSSPDKWPNVVTEDQLLSIIQKWIKNAELK